MRFSLVIPCYNEAANLPLLVDRIDKTFKTDGVEAILVDNGSTDDTPAVLRDLLGEEASGVRSVRVEKNQGYGFGILSGLAAATGDVVGWTHADMQTDPADALKGLEFFETATDPSRLFVKGMRRGRPIADQIFTSGMTVFETLLMGKSLRDINAQPTLFPRAFFETWSNPPSDFSLDLYAYYMAHVAGLKIQRFDVVFGERAHGSSHWNVDFKSKAKFIRRTVDFSLKLRKSVK